VKEAKKTLKSSFSRLKLALGIFR